MPFVGVAQAVTWHETVAEVASSRSSEAPANNQQSVQQYGRTYPFIKLKLWNFQLNWVTTPVRRAHR